METHAKPNRSTTTLCGKFIWNVSVCDNWASCTCGACKRTLAWQAWFNEQEDECNPKLGPATKSSEHG